MRTCILGSCILAVTVTLVGLLAGCQSPTSGSGGSGGTADPMVGTWTLTSETPSKPGLSQTVVVKSDNTFTISSTGTGNTFTGYGTWSRSGDTYTIIVTYQSDNQAPGPMTTTIVNNTFTVSTNNGTSTFTKS